MKRDLYKGELYYCARARERERESEREREKEREREREEYYCILQKSASLNAIKCNCAGTVHTPGVSPFKGIIGYP